MNFFSAINNIFLKMTWLKKLTSMFIENVLKVNINSKLYAFLEFYIYDTIKIFILLSVLIFSVSYIQSYFPPEKTKQIIGKFKGIQANIFAALLGTLTPFCSCSSVPLFIGFTNSRLPIGATFSFLISSPLVDLASVLLLASIFGFKIAILYVIIGIIIATVCGTIISKLKLEKYVEPFVFNKSNNIIYSQSLTKRERIEFSKEQVIEIIKRVWLYILIGVGIGALIHNYIPKETITSILGAKKWYSVFVATIIGIPIYADIFGTLPIAEALVYKGVGLGTALSFMMAVTALSLPSLIMLKKVIKTRLLVIFVFLVSIGIIINGFIFNLII